MLKKANAFGKSIVSAKEIINVTQFDRTQLGSSSKGSQIRWYKDNKFIKLDCLGYEGMSEELVSILLDYTNVPHVKYKSCIIYEDGKLLGDGCYSENFLEERERLFTFAAILKKFSRNYASFTYDEVFEMMYDATELDVRKYVDQCLCVDAIIKNEDRHFNNLAIIKGRNGFRTAPLFDNGLACLADTFTFPENVELNENLKHVYAKPFYTSFRRQLSLVHEPIKLDKKSFLESIDEKKYGRAIEVLKLGLDETEGLAWQ